MAETDLQFLQKLWAISLDLGEGEWNFSPTFDDYVPYVVVSSDGAIIAHAEDETIAELICEIKNSLPTIKRRLQQAVDHRQEVEYLRQENGKIRFALNILRSELEDEPIPLSERVVSWFRKRLSRAKAQ